MASGVVAGAAVAKTSGSFQFFLRVTNNNNPEKARVNIITNVACNNTGSPVNTEYHCAINIYFISIHQIRKTILILFGEQIMKRLCVVCFDCLTYI